MFCVNCGSTLASEAVSCQTCGAKVEPSADEIATEEIGRPRKNFLKNVRLDRTLSVNHIFAWVCTIVSGATLVLGIVILILTSLGLFASTAVSFKEVQDELSNKKVASGFTAEIDTLRGQFAHLDDQRWTQARELIGGWVEQWSAEPKEKTRFLAEIKAVAVNFPQEQRSAAVDAFYRLPSSESFIV